MKVVPTLNFSQTKFQLFIFIHCWEK